MGVDLDKALEAQVERTATSVRATLEKKGVSARIQRRSPTELVVELTGSASRIVEEPLPVDDPKVRKPDISRARTMLGWEPTVPVREGLTRTIEYFTGLKGTPFMAPRQPRPRRPAGSTL